MDKLHRANSIPAITPNNSGNVDLHNIRVFCRLRKQNQLERREGAKQCSTVLNDSTIFIRGEKCDMDEIRCTFDRVFDISSTQEEVYYHTAQPFINDFLHGFNCTIFAYGQTGSGKTHTIFGPKEGWESAKLEEEGIIPRIIRDIYSRVDTNMILEKQDASKVKVELSASFVEIYMEQIKDLLAIANSNNKAIGSCANNLKLRECTQKGIYIEELTKTACSSASSMLNLVRAGAMNRSMASTRMNKDSSRSHTILMINAKASLATGDITTSTNSTMYIVDLAGSEFVNKTNASGKVLQEAKSINKSLSALSNVLKALVESKKHVPYRDSKLTRLLQDSLGGSAKTCVILAASCSSYNMAETISTLRFGLRAKEIKNPVIVKREDIDSEKLMDLYQQAILDLESKNAKIAVLEAKLQLSEMKLDYSNDKECQLQNKQYFNNPKPLNLENDEISNGIVGQEDSICRNIAPTKSPGKSIKKIIAEPAVIVTENTDEVSFSSSLESTEANRRSTIDILELQRLVEIFDVDTSSGQPILHHHHTHRDVNEGASSKIPLMTWLGRESTEKQDANRLVEENSDTSEYSEATDYNDEEVSYPKDAIEQLPHKFTNDDITSKSNPKSTLTLVFSKTDCDQENPANQSTLLHSKHDPPEQRAAALIPDCCHKDTDSSNICPYRVDAENLSRQIVELKLQLHYLSESTRGCVDGEQYAIIVENARLKTLTEDLEFQLNQVHVKVNQLEMKLKASETRLGNQDAHIVCLQNSLYEYQSLFKQQIIMSQEKCRLLSDELEFYKKLSKTSQQTSRHLFPGQTIEFDRKNQKLLSKYQHLELKEQNSVAPLSFAWDTKKCGSNINNTIVETNENGSTTKNTMDQINSSMPTVQGEKKRQFNMIEGFGSLITSLNVTTTDVALNTTPRTNRDHQINVKPIDSSIIIDKRRGSASQIDLENQMKIYTSLTNTKRSGSSPNLHHTMNKHSQYF